MIVMRPLHPTRIGHGHVDLIVQTNEAFSPRRARRPLPREHGALLGFSRSRFQLYST